MSRIGALRRALSRPTDTEDILRRGMESPSDPLEGKLQGTDAEVQVTSGREFAEDVPGALEARPEPERMLEGERLVGRGPMRNINLDRLDTGPEVDKLLDYVSERTRNAGYELKPFAAIKAEGEKIPDEEVLGLLTGKKVNRKGLMNAAQLGRAREMMVTSANQIWEQSKNIAERARRGEVGDVELIDYQRSIYRHIAMQTAVQNNVRETARALSYLRDVVGPLNDVSLHRLMESGGGRDAILKKASIIANAGSVDKASVAVGQVGPWKWVNALVTYRNLQLLSGPRTHVRNMVGNTLTNLLSIPERAVAAGVSKIPLLGSGETQFGEAGQLIYANVMSQVDAWRMMGKSLRSNRSAFGAAKVDDIQSNYVESAMPVQASVTQKATEYGMAAINWSGRALTAADEYFKTLAFNQSMRSLGYRMASKEGLKGSARHARVNELISGPNQQNIYERLREEGLAGDELDVVFQGKLKAEEQAFYDLYKQSSDFAHYQTFTDDLISGWAKAGQTMTQSPALKLIMPFYKTNANLLSFAAERSPLALVTPNFWRELTAGGAKRDAAIARFGMGSGLSLIIGPMVWNGEVTGAGPSNPGLRTSYEEAGWRPYSIKIGGDWVSYQGLEPLSTQLAAIATAHDIMKYSTSEKQRDNIAMVITAAVAESLKDRTMMEGFSQFIDGLEATKAGSSTGFIERLGASFMLQSGALRTAAQVVDPTKRSTKIPDVSSRMLAEVQKMVPYWSSNLPPQISIWGEERRYDEPVGPDLASPFYSPVGRDDPASTAIAENAVPVRVPRETITFLGKRINLFELTHGKGEGWAYHDYMRAIGKERKKAVDRLIKSAAFKKLPPGPPGGRFEPITRGTELARVISQAKHIATQKFMGARHEAFVELRETGRGAPFIEAPEMIQDVNRPDIGFKP